MVVKEDSVNYFVLIEFLADGLVNLSPQTIVDGF